MDNSTEAKKATNTPLPEHDPNMKWLEPENLQHPPKWRVELLNLLNSLEYEGSFWVSLEPPDISVTVKDVGYVHSCSDTTQELIKKAVKAPYGKGSETIVDENVRNTWKIDPSDVEVNIGLESVVKRVKKGLGISDNIPVEAKLHQLLVYEKGSFFKPHTDSEKEKGMFGTMAIQFKSSFKGGAMKIQHKEDVQLIKLEDFESRVVAWYADCVHELEPLESGHRYVLVYNLIQSQKTSVSVKTTEVPFDISAALEAFYPILDSWKDCNKCMLENISSEADTSKEAYDFCAFVYPLDHQYTMSCFRTEIQWEEFQDVYYNKTDRHQLDENNWRLKLKGRDRTVVRFLDQAGLDIDMCIHEVETCIDSEYMGKYVDCSTCYVIREGELVNAGYQPRGYCGSSLFVASKDKDDVHRWMNNQLQLDKLKSKYDLLAEGEVEQYTGNEGTDGHGWYRTCFLMVKPKPDLKRKS